MAELELSELEEKDHLDERHLRPKQYHECYL